MLCRMAIRAPASPPATGATRVALAAAALLVGACSGESGHEAPPDARASDVADRDALYRDAAEHDATERDARGADRSATDGGGQGDAPNTFDGTLAVHTGDCRLGEIGASLRGVPAYCQPESTTGFYQCDELANRFMRDALHHPDLDNVVTEGASSICARASKMTAYRVFGPHYDAARVVPVQGDLIVYPGTPGHVAVIAGFSSPTAVTVIQENAGPSSIDLPWDPAASFFTSAECWVHAERAPPAELPDGSSCPCFAGGETCGLAIVDHEWWYGCRATVPEGRVEYGSLYSCEGGVFEKTHGCPALCITSNLFDASGYCGE
jgi:hypothetical protein